MNALPVPPAAAMPLRFAVSLPTPMTKVGIFGVPMKPVEAACSTGVRGSGKMLHVSGSPSVASTTMTTSPGWAIDQAWACCTAPCSAATVGVVEMGACCDSDCVILLATPGRGAISTSGVA